MLNRLKKQCKCSPGIAWVFILLCALWLACPQPPTQIEIPQEVYPLTGRVVESIGGSPVGEALVTISGTELSAYTDSDGIFSFENVTGGFYTIGVTKPGRAGSQLQHVFVGAEPDEAILIQPEYSYDEEAVTPPTVRISGIERDAEYSGMVPLEISVIPGSCPVLATDFHMSISLRIGITGLAYYNAATSSSDTLSYLWNTTGLPPGKVVIKLVAFDNNNNRSEWNIPVKIAENPGQLPGIAPREEYYSIVANTYGQSMDLTRLFPRYPELQQQQAAGSRTSAADSTIVVDFSVAKYYHGIAVYKSASAAGPFALAGQTAFTESGGYKFLDFSPSLKPDTTVYYKLAYFNQYGIGPATEPIAVRILPKYNLRLTGPVNNSIITDTTPTLHWTCEPFLDAQRTDWVIARNVLDATTVAYSFVINTTELTLQELLYNNLYEWDVRSYYQYVNSGQTANVLSWSFPGGKGATDYSINGAYYFTVVQ